VLAKSLLSVASSDTYGLSGKTLRTSVVLPDCQVGSPGTWTLLPDGRDPRCYHASLAEDRVVTMKKWHFVVIAASVMVAACILFVLYTQSKGTFLVEGLREAVERANYCVIDADCAPLGPVCPFGCGMVVNRNERQRILDEIKAAPITWDCYSRMYKCRNDSPVCVDRKCRDAK